MEQENVTLTFNGLTNKNSTEDISIESILFASFFFLISFVAVLGNLLVMIAIYSNNCLQTTSNYLLANLALTDFLQGLISVPLRALESLSIDQDIRVLCQASIPVSILFGSTSNLNILFISIDRFIAIFFPYFYVRKITPKIICTVIVFCWVFMVFVSLSPTVGIGGKIPEGTVVFCRFHVFLTQTYITFLYIIVHAIPIFTVMLIYGFILRASLQHARRIHNQVSAVQSGIENEKTNENAPRTQSLPRNTAKQMKAARIVSYVLGFFILLVVPIILVDIIEMLGGPAAPKWFVKIAVCMIYTNHCVNVLVYAGCNQDFRKAFIKTLSQCKDFILCKGFNS